jgi:hypothetical protein
MSKMGYIAPGCKYILLSNTLIVCFLCKIDHTIYRCIRVKKLATALASKDNTMAEPRIYLRRIRPHFGTDVYERHIYYIYILIYYQVVYICYILLCFVAWHLFILFLPETWPEYSSLFVLGYRLVKNILNLTEHFQIRPCHFFFLPCLIIFASNYVSVSFDIS